MNILLLIGLMCVQFFFAGMMLVLAILAIINKEKWVNIIRDFIVFFMFFVPGLINALEVIVKW